MPGTNVNSPSYENVSEQASRPTPLPVNFDEIPEGIRYLNQWVCWRYEWKEGKDGKPGKWDKVPYIPPNWKASPTASHTWISFIDVKTAYEAGKFDGIGLVIQKKHDINLQLVGFDFDKCRNPTTGEITPKIKAYLDKLNTYSEISPSGTGIRAFAKGDMREDGRRAKGIEIYKHAHYLTVTGQRLKEYPATIEARPNEILEIYSEYFGDSNPEQTDDPRPNKTCNQPLSDEQIVSLATSANNSEKFLGLFSGSTQGYASQSEADEALACILAFYTRDKAKIIRIIRQSKLWDEKWERVDYQDKTIDTALKLVTKNYSGYKSIDFMTLERALEIVSDLDERFKADRRAIKDPEILEALSVIKAEDPIEFDLIVGPITEMGIGKRSIETELKKNAQKRRLISNDADSGIQDSPQEIKEAARAILEKGNPIQFIADSCGRMVLGADRAFKKLICCVSVQNVNQSSGLHPKLNGASSGGKTITVMMFAHHLPAEMVNKGSMSAKAAFYHGFKARSFNIIDDYRPGGNPDLDTVIKQTSSLFHQKYEHRTVIDGKPDTLELNPEQTWAITSIDASQDIQVLNRQIMINMDDSEEMTRQVNSRTINRYGNGEILYALDEQVLICREIFRILRNEGYINVRIPFKDRIEWIDTSNRRNPSIFFDLLIAITGMNRFQRERDEDCYLATEEDFQEAKALFVEKEAEEMVHRLSPTEREFAELLSKRPDGLTKAESAKALGVTTQRISQIANSLSSKVTGFEESEITDTAETPDGKRRSTRLKLYNLSGYNSLEGFDAIVKLRDSSSQTKDEEGNVQRKSPQLSMKGQRKVDERVVERVEETNNISNSSIISVENCVQRKGETPGERVKNISPNPVTIPEKNIFSSQSGEKPFIKGESASCGQISDFHRGYHDLSATFIDSSKTFHRRPDERDSQPTCFACGEPIGKDHSSYYGKFCGYCGPKLSMVRAAAKTHPNGFTSSELWEDLAARGRPPRKEHLPAMLRAAGCIEEGGCWRYQEASA